MTCNTCQHQHLLGVCGAPITDDIYVADSPYGGNKRFYRSIVVDTCQCRAAAAVVGEEPQ